MDFRENAVNEAMLRKVGDYIAANPEAYLQDLYVYVHPCGTRFCIAGATVFLHDTFLEWDDPDRNNEVWMKCGDHTYEKKWIDDAAREILGLGERETEILFSGSWRPLYQDQSLPLHEQVKCALYEIADGKPVREV